MGDKRKQKRDVLNYTPRTSPTSSVPHFLKLRRSNRPQNPQYPPGIFDLGFLLAAFKQPLFDRPSALFFHGDVVVLRLVISSHNSCFAGCATGISKVNAIVMQSHQKFRDRPTSGLTNPLILDSDVMNCRINILGVRS
jgi:hypothetical protein